MAWKVEWLSWKNHQEKRGWWQISQVVFVTQIWGMHFKITLNIERSLSKIRKNKRAELLHFRWGGDVILCEFLLECNLFGGDILPGKETQLASLETPIAQKTLAHKRGDMSIFSSDLICLFLLCHVCAIENMANKKTDFQKSAVANLTFQMKLKRLL